MRLGAAALLLLGACASAPPSALPAHAGWVAIGQEPGWRVDAHPGKSIEVIADYGDRRASLPYAAPRIVEGALEFQSAGGTDHFRLRITPEACADSMSGRPYPASAHLTFNGRSYQGCAGPQG